MRQVTYVARKVCTHRTFPKNSSETSPKLGLPSCQFKTYCGKWQRPPELATSSCLSRLVFKIGATHWEDGVCEHHRLEELRTL